MSIVNKRTAVSRREFRMETYSVQNKKIAMRTALTPTVKSRQKTVLAPKVPTMFVPVAWLPWNVT
jgi:hypothetical protein